MEKDLRLYNCVYCRQQCLICSCCDRGNIYCKKCALEVRKFSLKRASERYQKSHKGRVQHAARQKLYRERQKQKLKIVTHQGSPPTGKNDLLPKKLQEVKIDVDWMQKEQYQCHFCGRSCSNFVRLTFIQRKVARLEKNILFA